MLGHGSRTGVKKNSPAHPHLDCLKNSHMEFLLLNTTSLVKPMDMGIIKILKTVSCKVGKLHS